MYESDKNKLIKQFENKELDIQEIIEESFDLGTEEGYDDGHSDGYDEGYDDGYDMGCEDSQEEKEE